MADFETVAKASELRPGEMKLIDMAGEKIVVANVDGNFFAFSNTCTHVGGPLSASPTCTVGRTACCQPRSRPPDPPPHVQSKPGGGTRLPRLLLVKPDRPGERSLDGLLGHG